MAVRLPECAPTRLDPCGKPLVLPDRLGDWEKKLEKRSPNPPIRGQGMNSRERILRALHHEEADRVALFDFPWLSAIDRWHREGLPTDVNPAEYFGWDMLFFSPDTSPMLPIEVIDQDEGYVTETTSYGGVVRNRRDYASTPQRLRYSCETRQEWEEKIKPRLVPRQDRVDWEGHWLEPWSGSMAGAGDAYVKKCRFDWRAGLEGCKRGREAGYFTCFYKGVGFDAIQNYVGVERLLLLTADDPDWVRDMYETDAALVMAMCETMRQGGFEFDAALLTCDLGGRNGLLFSPEAFDQLLRPSLKRLLDYFNSHEMPVILHSDGDVRKLIPRLVEDGVTCLQPLEAKAGMDLVGLKEEWGDRLALAGGIDVRAMADEDPRVVEEEIRCKITVAKRGGGYIYCADHSVPDNVSFKQYQQVLELVRQYGRYSAASR